LRRSSCSPLLTATSSTQSTSKRKHWLNPLTELGGGHGPYSRRDGRRFACEAVKEWIGAY
jgi:hypothetical protein